MAGKVRQRINRAQKKRAAARFYKLNSILGNTWAMFYVILGGRMTGKSYSLTEYLCKQKKKKGDNVQNYWMRISETSTKAMLANKAERLVDIDLVRKYNLELSTKGANVYDHGKPFMTVLPLSQFAKLKGVAFYDKDFKGEINIVLDEFQLEQGERRTSFDILYNFLGMIENTVRTMKSNLRIFIVGNTLEEASSILKAFDFLPEKFGRFYLKRKRCVIDNLEPTEEYLKDRYGSAADILGGKSMSNYTNELKRDISMIDKSRKSKAQAIIKFGKEQREMFLLWDKNIVTFYKRQPIKNVFAMRPYLDEYFSLERKKKIIDLFDAKALKFDSLITLSYFQAEMEKIRK